MTTENLKSKASIERYAKAEFGGFSKPAKMPCLAFSIPANKCKTGSKLAKQKNTVCSDCYACKGSYGWPSTVAALDRRFDKLGSLNWEAAFIKSFNALADLGETYFRWHDSGDIQSVDHLISIVNIAINTPRIKFWIPTREYNFVRQFLDMGLSFPDNLTVRLSAHMVGKTTKAFKGTVTSSVDAGNGYLCPSSKQDGKCKDCRACWDKKNVNIDYEKH